MRIAGETVYISIMPITAAEDAAGEEKNPRLLLDKFFLFLIIIAAQNFLGFDINFERELDLAIWGMSNAVHIHLLGAKLCNKKINY